MARLDGNPTLLNALHNNTPFVYAHLVKFERPTESPVAGSMGVFSLDEAKNYAYFSDAAFDVVFDDGSKTADGVSNGAQTYIANKLISIGNIADSTEVKVTSTSLTLDATPVDASFTDSIAVTLVSGNLTITATNTSFPEAGFRVGDVISFSSGVNIGGDFQIERIVTDNSVQVTIVTKPHIIKEAKRGAASNILTLKEATASLNIAVGDTVQGEGIPANTTIVSPNGTHSFNLSNNITVDPTNFDEKFTFSNTGRTHAATSLTLSMTAAEITGLLHSSATDKVSFVNRRITIYKAFFYADNPHTFIGTPLKIFSGVITNASFEEDPAKGAKVTWSLSNFLGDFRRIKGRLTSHEAHQGITNTGGVDSRNALRAAYAEDRGFEHSELSFNMIAQYGDYDKEPKYKKKKVGGFLGISFLGGQNVQVPDGYKYIPVTREVDIRFDLDAKYLPVVYGVQRVKGIPVFADVDKDLTGDRQSSVFTANAICEGPIQSVLNIYIDDKALSCTSIDDAKKRNPSASGSTAAEIEEAQNADVKCIGQADQGIVLEGNFPSTSFGASRPTTGNAYQTYAFTDGTGYAEGGVGFSQSVMPRQWSTGSLSFQSGPKGITHEKAINISSPMTSYIEIHNGLYDQKASALLCDQAENGGGFVLQDQAGLLNPRHEEYWGSKHQLLDTAYSVNNFVIGEEETSIPSIEYVVSGKLLECFNYDGSYIHSSLPTFSSENHANFKEGNVVEIRTTFNFTSTTTKLNSSGEIVLIGDGVGSGETAISLSADGLLFSTTIIDKFFYRDQFGDSNYRFRWDLTAAQQTLLSEAGYFYMKLGSNDWHMLTYDSQDVPNLGEITVAEIFTAEVTQTSSGSSAFTATLSDVSFASDSAYNLTNADLMFFQPNGGGREGGPDDYLTRSAVIPGNITQITGGNGVTIPGTTSTDALASGTKVTIVNQVKFSSNASNVDDIYNGKKVVFTRRKHILFGRGVNIERTIVDYDGNTKVATLDSDPSSGLLRVGDIVNLTAQSADRPQRVSGETLGAGDLRPSNNFAMIALDYIKSERYGLDIASTEISLPDFQLAAVECDTQSDVEVEFASSVSLTAGTVYRRYQNGHEKWRGTVLATATGTSHTFTNITGKLASKFNTFAERSSGDLVYDGTSLFRIDSDDGTATGGNFQTVVQTSISNHADFIASPTITKVGSGAGPSTLTMVGHNFTDRTTGNPVNSYSLYDSDDILYWKYLGWTEQRQRYVTRHQGNLVVDTSNPVLDNLKGILAHFNALIYFADGKLKLKVTAARNSEGPESDSNFDDSNPDVDVRVRYITDEDIIGKISIKDEGLNKSHNTISASIPDPALDFNDRSITFMDSTFKKEDRGVTKSANYSLPGITNYYNARMGAKQALNASRVSRTISFTMRPAGIAILPGELIRVNYPRFGWGTGTEVLFRVKSVGIAKDCLVSITATEHDDSVYVITKNIKSAFFKDEIVAQAARTPGAPGSVAADSVSEASGNKITWTAASGISPSTGRYELWRAVGFSGNAATAVTAHAEKIGEVESKQLSFIDLNTISTTAQTFVYWIRAYNVEAPQTTSGIRKGVKKYFGPFNDNSDYGGVGQSAAAQAALKALEESITLSFSKNGIPVPTASDGSSPNFSAINGQITVEIGNKDITNQITGFATANLAGFSAGQFSINSSGAYTVTGMTADSASIDVTASIPANSTTGLSTSTTITRKFTLNKAKDGRTISASLSGVNFVYDAAGNNPSPSSATVTATVDGATATVYYEFLVNGSSQQNSTSNTFTYTPQSTFSNQLGQRVSLNVREGGTSSTVLTRATMIPQANRPGADGVDGADGSDGSAGAAGRVVNLLATTQSFSYNTNGASPSPSSSTLTAAALNTSGTIYYEFFKNDVSQQNTTSNTYTYTPQASYSNMPDKIEVQVREGSSSGTIVARDQETLFGVRAGTSATTIILGNEAHTLSTTNTGTVSFTGSGTDIEVFIGNTPIPYDDSSPFASPSYRVSASGVNISVGAASTVSTNIRRFANHSNMSANDAIVTFTIIVKDAAGVETTFTRKQSLSKSIQGADGASITGATGPRTATGYIYYQQASSSNPGAPSESGVSYNFATSLLSGGVIGTGSTNWNQIAPTFTGSNANKYWYAYYSVTEASFGGTQTIDFSIAYEGQNFTGLVTFTGTSNQISDGLGNTTTALVSADLGSSGSTTIDGNRITTGVIKSSNLSGTQDGSGFTTAGSIFNLSNGVIASKNFRIASDGTAVFGGTLIVGGSNVRTNTSANFRSDIGAGTSSFAGTQAAIEAAITNKADFRSDVGAGTSSFSGSAADLSGSISPSRFHSSDFPMLSAVTAADAAAARTAIGAGTSNFNGDAANLTGFLSDSRLSTSTFPMKSIIKAADASAVATALNLDSVYNKTVGGIVTESFSTTTSITSGAIVLSSAGVTLGTNQTITSTSQSILLDAVSSSGPRILITDNT